MDSSTQELIEAMQAFRAVFPLVDAMLFMMFLYTGLSILKFLIERLSDNQKSYQAEMSIYDTERPAEQPRTGITLEDLQALAISDGEIPDSAYRNQDIWDDAPKSENTIVS